MYLFSLYIRYSDVINVYQCKCERVVVMGVPSPRGLTGASSRLVRSRFTLLLPTIPLPLVIVVVAGGGVVLRGGVVFPRGLTVLGARVWLRTFTLLRWGSPHHGLHVAQG